MIRSLLLSAALLLPLSAAACPQIDGNVDFNCDGIHKVAITGDSLVTGRGDLRFNNNGGYSLRVGRTLKTSSIQRLGMPGFSSQRVFERIKMRMESTRNNAIKSGLLDADLVIIDMGRNDFFTDVEPGFTVRNIKRLIKYLKRKLAQEGHTAPLFAVATLTPTTRGFQRPFVEGVNTLLAEFSSPELPVRLFFNNLDPALISADGIHPTTDGYMALADDTLAYLKDGAVIEALARRPDADRDGIYDAYEKKKFLTNPKLADTDGDTLPDGDEAFTLGTSPTSADTDADGSSDLEELTLGSNPLDPSSTPLPVVPVTVSTQS